MGAWSIHKVITIIVGKDMGRIEHSPERLSSKIQLFLLHGVDGDNLSSLLFVE
jgi:hypothetical protein